MIDIAKQVCICLVMAGALYGGIRADLAHAIKESERANERLDVLLMERAKNG